MISMKRNSLFRNKKAFTLVELIVVIAILGVLASIVTVSASSAKKSSEKRAATSAIVGYWNTTNNYFYQLNATRTGPPKVAQLKTRLGNDVVQGIGEDPPTSLSKGKIYIQYAVNNGNVGSKYTIVKITYNYSGRYYSSVDGSTVTGPRDSL